MPKKTTKVKGPSKTKVDALQHEADAYKRGFRGGAVRIAREVMEEALKEFALNDDTKAMTLRALANRLKRLAESF